MLEKLRSWIEERRTERRFRRVTRELEAGRSITDALKASGETDPAMVAMYRQILEGKGFK